MATDEENGGTVTELHNSLGQRLSGLRRAIQAVRDGINSTSDEGEGERESALASLDLIESNTISLLTAAHNAATAAETLREEMFSGDGDT